MQHGGLGVLAGGYVILCGVVAPVTLLRLVWLRCFHRPPPVVRFHGRQRAKLDLASAAATPAELNHHWLARLPLNEILQLDVTRWVLDVPRLAPALDGLSIVHLSDLHLTGRVGKAYFREVVRTSNELRPDLVCITGDIVERSSCFDWIADTLGRLTARHGVYFILGNHDRRVDAGRLRRALEQNGLIDLGNRRLQIEIDGTPVMLAGNERPWFDGPAGWVSAASRTRTHCCGSPWHTLPIGWLGPGQITSICCWPVTPTVGKFASRRSARSSAPRRRA